MGKPTSTDSLVDKAVERQHLGKGAIVKDTAIFNSGIASDAGADSYFSLSSLESTSFGADLVTIDSVPFKQIRKGKIQSVTIEIIHNLLTVATTIFLRKNGVNGPVLGTIAAGNTDPVKLDNLDLEFDIGDIVIMLGKCPLNPGGGDINWNFWLTFEYDG